MSTVPTWTAEAERRLIEMHRSEILPEVMAKELSLPLDLIEARLMELDEEAESPPRLF